MNEEKTTEKKVLTPEELEERFFSCWIEDDGFNIKEGPRNDSIDLFFELEDPQK